MLPPFTLLRCNTAPAIVLLANVLGVKMCLWRWCLGLSAAAAVSIEQFRGETTAREIERFGIFCPEGFFQLQN